VHQVGQLPRIITFQVIYKWVLTLNSNICAFIIPVALKKDKKKKVQVII